MVTGTAYALRLQAILLITEQCIQRVLGTIEVSLIVGQILVVDSECAAVRSRSGTISSSLATECAIKSVATAVDTGNSDVCCQVQTCNRSNHSAPVAVEHISVVLGTVIDIVADGVTGHTSTLEVGGGTAIIYRHTILSLDASVGITYIQGIDGSHGIGCIEHIAAATPRCAIVRLLRIRIGIVHVAGDAQPVASLIVHIHTTIVTLQTRVVHDTLIVEEANTCIVAQTVAGTAQVDIVLLTETVVDGLVVPVIGSIEELTI